MVVISADGKGIVMRPQALRPGTAKAAVSKKLRARLSKGERPYGKRMAEVGAVYEVSRVPCQSSRIWQPPAFVDVPGVGRKLRHRLLMDPIVAPYVFLVDICRDEHAVAQTDSDVAIFTRHG